MTLSTSLLPRQPLLGIAYVLDSQLKMNEKIPPGIIAECTVGGFQSCYDHVLLSCWFDVQTSSGVSGNLAIQFRSMGEPSSSSRPPRPDQPRSVAAPVAAGCGTIPASPHRRQGCRSAKSNFDPAGSFIDAIAAGFNIRRWRLRNNFWGRRQPTVVRSFSKFVLRGP